MYFQASHRRTDFGCRECRHRVGESSLRQPSCTCNPWGPLVGVPNVQKNPGSVALLSHRATVFLQCPLPSSFSLSKSSPSVFTSARPITGVGQRAGGHLQADHHYMFDNWRTWLGDAAVTRSFIHSFIHSASVFLAPALLSTWHYYLCWR